MSKKTPKAVESAEQEITVTDIRLVKVVVEKKAFFFTTHDRPVTVNSQQYVPVGGLLETLRSVQLAKVLAHGIPLPKPEVKYEVSPPLPNLHEKDGPTPEPVI